MIKVISTFLCLMLIGFGLFAQKEQITLTFSGTNSNNQTVTLDSVLVENVTQALSESVYYPDLSITLEYEAGIGENSSDIFKGSMVYPNPFNSYSIVSVNNPEKQEILISIIDNTGRVIIETSELLLKGVHKFRLKLPKTGIFNIIISNGKQKSILKAISLINKNFSHTTLEYAGQGELIDTRLKSTHEILTIPYQHDDVLRFTAYATGYPIVSITDSPTTNESYEFEFSQFFRLSEQLVETETPCFVNIMFQVTNENHVGVDNLSTEIFLVTEDNQPVSPTETFMYINKMSSIPYQMKTVLLLDNSASVAPNLDQIKTAAINLVNNIVDKQEVAILVFSDEITLLTDFTDDIDDLVAAINSIQLGYPSTDLYGSIIEAVSMWNDSYSIDLIQQGFLVALTDGDDTQASHTLSEALNAIGNKRVYMIGLGNEINPNALEQLANPGPFYNPNQANELIEIFNEIQTDIVKFANSFYWMNYMSPKREGTHSLGLEVKSNTNTGNDSYISSDFYAGDFYSVSSGVYVNANDSYPYGKDTLYITDSATMQLKAVTYWAYESPVYEWGSSNPDKIEIIFDELDNSKIEIFAHGDSLDFSTITITDVANNYNNSVHVVGSGTFTDPRNNQTYTTVVIGEQVWFAQNLNYETNNSWCFDNNGSNCDEYGRLYKWDAAATACPDGWHLPTDDEWKELEMFLGMSQSQANQSGWRGTDEGEKLKSETGWNNGGNGTDEVGFSALPGGYRYANGSFSGLGLSCYWWSATEYSSTDAWLRYLTYGYAKVYRDYFTKGRGFSVRCVRD